MDAKEIKINKSLAKRLLNFYSRIFVIEKEIIPIESEKLLNEFFKILCVLCVLCGENFPTRVW